VKLDCKWLLLINVLNYHYFTEPLVPYRVTVVAVNLAGPGEQETMIFFTREGGVFLTTHVLYMAYFYQKVSVIITRNAW